MSVVDAGVRVLLVLVFATAVATKLRSRSAAKEFVASLRPFASVGAVSRMPAGWLAGAVIGSEATAALLLAIPSTARLGLAASTIVLAGYGLGITLALRSGVRVTCRCFGAGSGSTLGAAEAIRNLALAALAGAALAVDATGSLPSAAGPTLLVTATAAVVLAVLAVRWDDVAFVLGGNR